MGVTSLAITTGPPIDYLRYCIFSKILCEFIVSPFQLHAHHIVTSLTGQLQEDKEKSWSIHIPRRVIWFTSCVCLCHFQFFALRLKFKEKLKFIPEHSTKAQRGSRGIAVLFFNLGARWGGWSTSRPGRSLPPGKTRYPLYRRLVGTQSRSGRVREISPPPGFHP